LREFGDALGGLNGVSLEMHMEAIIGRVEKYTLRL
jgi:hypothetical protein